MRSLFALSVALLCIPSTSAESLQIGENYYTETCNKQEWRLVGDQLNSIADGRAPQLLVSLAKAYICGQGANTKKYLLQFSTKTVISTSEGSGQEKTQDFVPSNEVIQPQAGKAWDTTIQGEYSKVTLSFFSNEACVRSVTFKQTNANWLIVGIGEACD